MGHDPSSDSDRNGHTRRKVLASLGALASVVGTAGCSGLTEPEGAAGSDTRTVNPALDGTPTRTPRPTEEPVGLSAADFPTGIDGFPMFGRDPQHTSYAPDDVGPAAASFGWQLLTDGAVHASPAIADGAVFVSSLDGHVYAIELATGERRWRVETGGGYSSPAVSDGTVYVGGRDGVIRALDAGTGDEQWAQVTGGKVQAAPTLADGTVFIGSFDTDLYALEAATGEVVWRVDTGHIVPTSPAVDSDRVYLFSHGGRLLALDRADGTEVWRRSTGADEFASPVVAGGTVFFGSMNDQLYAVDAETGEDRWWRFLRAGMPASPAVTPESVVVPVFDKFLYAFDTATGETRWRTEIGLAYSSPAIVGGVVHVGTATGTVFAVDAESGDVVWEYDAGADVRSSPAVTDETLVVGAADGSLHAVSESVGRPIATVVSVVLTGAPNGLEKFTVGVETGDVTIAELEPKLLTGTSFWVESGGIGATKVVASGIALDDQVSLGDDGEATLFRVGLPARLERDTTTLTVATLTDSDGEPMDPSFVELRLRYPEDTRDG